eukprot:GHVP01030668.1.p1 GENE.GHVP01030668.1~~GHVP01030668.1.p1  ORF type:complete len:185 (-),score=32.68 GHVP01030668.1:405-929(-)
MEFFGNLSEELTNTFVRPHPNLFEPDEEESGGVDFRADPEPEEDESELSQEPTADSQQLAKFRHDVGNLILDIKKEEDQSEMWKLLNNCEKERFRLHESSGYDGEVIYIVSVYPEGTVPCICKDDCSHNGGSNPKQYFFEDAAVEMSKVVETRKKFYDLQKWLYASPTYKTPQN